MMNNMKRSESGFTLIELMVVVTLIAILGGIAYSSYTNAVRKSHRTEATTEVMSYTQRIQRCFTVNGTFITSDTEKCQILDELEDGLTTARGYYSIAASDITATTYTLTATPVTGMGQDKDIECASFVINQAGTRSATDSADVDATSTCWK